MVLHCCSTWIIVKCNHLSIKMESK
ncbi:hypothetical protein LK536_02580 [Lachnoclostridium pacaense]|nr:hypothetical protein [Lachnoclostridium pacaense]